MSPLQTTGGKDDPNIVFILNNIIKIKLTFWPLASAAIKCRKRPEEKETESICSLLRIFVTIEHALLYHKRTQNITPGFTLVNRKLLFVNNKG